MLSASNGNGTPHQEVSNMKIGGKPPEREMGPMAGNSGNGSCTSFAAPFAGAPAVLIRLFRFFVRKFEYGNNSPSRGV
jgi:hypothetical protein